MIRSLLLFASLALSAVASPAADLPPDATTEIPASAKREVVIKLDKSDIQNSKSKIPRADLPDGFELQLVAAPPLVTYPIMGSLDDRGRLFVGDATGVNWNKKQLEENPPNRILMLEDSDGDGIYDKSTIFADKLTFPQGGCWFEGSLYVCSPPGIWKLTDTDGDGVADKREEIVTGFEYTGNAADVHGPWLHPNGRLYWCHGRKGHKVIGKEGTVVHEGLACGIWSCKPDGSDVQWHSLGCGDNPVKVDFTPEGEIIGVQNLYYNNPRGDTIVHWLYGGVYERSDQLKAIEGLPRTLEHMPVMYNFGHVAVSGCCFWRNYGSAGVSPVPSNQNMQNMHGQDARAPLQFLVTHFNTQRVVRMELIPDGATYKATENEFLRLHDPDIHLTDVLEDADGSLLVLNTGGWFRSGCPSSLMARPDELGAVYRVKKKGGRLDSKIPAKPKPYLFHTNAVHLYDAVNGSDVRIRRRSIELVAGSDGVLGDTKTEFKIIELLADKTLDPATEHAVMNAAIRFGIPLDDRFDKAKEPVYQRRLLKIISQQGKCPPDWIVSRADKALLSVDPQFRDLATRLLCDRRYDSHQIESIVSRLVHDAITDGQLRTSLLSIIITHLDDDAFSGLMERLLTAAAPLQKVALQAIAAQSNATVHDAWLPPIEKSLAEATSGDLPLLVDAIKKLKTNGFDEKLQSIANDPGQPLSLRLRALGAVKGPKLTSDTFAMLQSVLTDAGASAAARIQAATMLASAPLDKNQQLQVAPLFSSAGPVELGKLLPLLRKTKDPDLARALAVELAKSPVIASQQESIYRTALAEKPPDIFETIILPAYKKATEASEAKKRQLGPLAEKIAAIGDASTGRAIYESGKGTCIACHQIGDKGRTIGPNLSKIGAIRTERDILESILFPSNTLARDYEAHVIETGDGQSLMGVIKSHTAEGLLMVDVAGQEKNIPHTRIVSDTQLATSLMPVGLDQTLPEKDLCDLVAYLRSLK